MSTVAHTSSSETFCWLLHFEEGDEKALRQTKLNCQLEGSSIKFTSINLAINTPLRLNFSSKDGNNIPSI